ncbi:hypothetical protein BV20DRAFT_1054995 [Pilatotrama ljubarskyi]|nr:hypothetical protein BV20DRAFT_1054995 [Pilatotrama ljubarskyi]
MSPKRRTGAASKPSAQPKPVATTSKPPTATTSSAAPARATQASTVGPTATSSSQRVSPPPTAPSRPGVTIQTNPVAPPPRTFAQPPKPTAQPAKSALASHLRHAPAAAPASAARPAPAQKRTFTRSDRVRAEWHDFEATWVRTNQSQIERELDELFKAAERTSRAKGKGGTPSGMDKIVSQMQRDFALAARDEWEARLQRAGLQAEDWTDMTLEEMIAVEQVLSYDDSDSEPGVYAQARHGSVADSISSGSTVVADTTPPSAARSLGGWKTHTTSTQAAPPRKTAASQPLRNTQSVAPQHSMAAATSEHATKKSAQTWGAKHNPVVEDLRTLPKEFSTPNATPSTSRSAQPASKTAPAVAPPLITSELLVYPVPIALTQPPLDPELISNAAYMGIVEKLHINSIRQFHAKATEADIEFARQLRKPMPPADREFAIRAHKVAMEQCARDIVLRRNELLEIERKKLSLGGDSALPSALPPAPQPRSVQPPGAFPEERAQPAKQPPAETEPLLEYTPDAEPEPEREPEEVDEVIEIPLKGKGKKKGKKAAVETKAAGNGRSTPTPAAAPSTARPATPTQKAAPTVEAKGKSAAPAIAPWNAARTSAPARAASPAPINTKVASSTADGRSSPAPSPSSSTPTPWQAAQAKSSGASSSAAAGKAAAAQNGIWAPPMARATSSNKNPFAPVRPSRLAKVTPVPEPDVVPQSPESPEPPSPPAGEPTGRDYVAWFAGSSSEDDDSTFDGLLDEDEGDDEEQSRGPGGVGGLLASLAGASPWALFGGESNQSQKRAASPARGRGTTPTPARAAAARYTPAPDPQPACAFWGAPTAGPSGYSAGPSSAPKGPPGMWKEEGDDLEQMLDFATSTLDKAAKGSARGGGANIEEAMAMYVTAAKARETLTTPVGGRSAWKQ